MGFWIFVAGVLLSLFVWLPWLISQLQQPVTK
jgi:hypothetical protein